MAHSPLERLYTANRKNVEQLLRNTGESNLSNVSTSRIDLTTNIELYDSGHLKVKQKSGSKIKSSRISNVDAFTMTDKKLHMVGRTSKRKIK